MVFKYKLALGGSPIDQTNLTVFIERTKDRFDATLSPLFATMQAVPSTSQCMATIKSGIFDSESPESQELYNFVETICSWIGLSWSDRYHRSCNWQELAQLIPYVNEVFVYEFFINFSLIYFYLVIHSADFQPRGAKLCEKCNFYNSVPSLHRQ